MKTPAQILADKAVARNTAKKVPVMPTTTTPVQQPAPVQAPVPTQQNTLWPNMVKREITPYTPGTTLQATSQIKPIATPSKPVVAVGTPQPKPPQGIDYNASLYDPYKSYGKEDIQNWLDLASVRVWQWQQLSEQDQLVGRYMQRKLWELSAPWMLEDPTQKLIEEQRKAQEDARIRLQGQDQSMYDAEQQRINAYYEKRKAETLEAWKRRQDQVQTATSFSWFGRSTFNADQQAQIQKEAEQAISLDQQEMQLALDKYRRQLEGATAEELQGYDERINDLQGQSMQFKMAQYDAINQYNQQNASNISEAIDNLFSVASQNQPSTPLTEDEVAQAQAYAQLIVWADGTVDTKLLETIPPRLISSAIMQGAQLKWAIEPERDPYEFKTAWDSAFVFDPNTWEFRQAYQEAPKQSFQKVWDQWYSFNPVTWEATPATLPWWMLWDIRHLAWQFPWQARAKNNNPAWITWNANFDNPKPWTTAYALQQAWIQYNKWTSRPPSEWWNYVTFNTIEDGLAAQRIMMTQTYWNATVDKMLQSWVGTKEWPNYAKQVAWMAWIPLNIPVNQLSDDQLAKLQMAKTKKESPWLAKLLEQQPTQWWISWSQFTDSDIAVLWGVAKLDKQWREVLKENWFTERDWAEFKDWLLPPTNSQKKMTTELLDLVNSLEKHPWLPDAVWFKWLQTWRTMPWSDKADFLSIFATLTDKLASNNLDKIKGAMSDKDIEFLRNIEKQWLSLENSENQFKEILWKIKANYQQVLDKWQQAQTTPTPQQQQTQPVSTPKQWDREWLLNFINSY